MDIFAKVHKILPKEQGISSSGNFYTKQSIVVEIDNGAKRLAIEFFGDKKVSKLSDVNVGDFVQVGFSVESRPIEKDEQERWFTSINGIYLTKFMRSKDATPADD